MYDVKSIFVALMAGLWLTGAFAESPAWISEKLQTAVNGGPDINARFVGTVVAGEAVKLLGKSKDGRYAHIKTDKLEGWIAARYVSDRPSVRSRFRKVAIALDNESKENARLRAERDNTAGNVGQLRKTLDDTRQTLEKVKSDYIALQRASANVITIDKRNRELQGKLISLEQDNLKLRHENIRLEESQSQKKMYLGAGLVIGGFLLHWLFNLFVVFRRRSPFDEL